jgi:UDP-N-acetylglucosamine:LPS N-acetylglucosamine transferase
VAGLKGRMRICLAASAGGHLTQLLKLSDCWNDHEVFWVSTLGSAVQKIQKFGRFYIIGECNREHPWQVLRVLKNCIRIILKEKPDVIISAGAGPACLLCIVGKLLGAKIVWVDSIANVERLSLSGRIIRPLADLILSQWPEVAKKYKSVCYAGNLL